MRRKEEKKKGDPARRRPRESHARVRVRVCKEEEVSPGQRLRPCSWIGSPGRLEKKKRDRRVE